MIIQRGLATLPGGATSYFEDDIESAIVQIQYGANGVTMQGVMV